MKTSSGSGYYDADYYRMRYGRLIEDPAYYALSGDFWHHSIAVSNDLELPRPILDWGSGPGHTSAALGADCYDPSAYIQHFLTSKGRTAYRSVEDIPRQYYQTILCSHALEHSLEPARDLDVFKDHLTGRGLLVLLLPVETTPGEPVRAFDENRHFYTWNFQAITNLLLARDFSIVQERVVHGPTGLGCLGQWAGRRAVRWAWRLGRLKRNYPSLLVAASYHPAARPAL